MLQGQYFTGNIFRCVCLSDGTTGLEQDRALIISFIDQMDGHAGFLLAGRFNRSVHIHAVHPLAAKFRQQRRVDRLKTYSRFQVVVRW